MDLENGREYFINLGFEILFAIKERFKLFLQMCLIFPITILSFDPKKKATIIWLSKVSTILT
jgi:hypothetical protein